MAKYDTDTENEILRRMSSGESLASICQGEAMPSCDTVFYWCHTRPDFKAKYIAAQEARAEAVFEEILAIADDGQNDTYVDDEGKTRTDHDVINRSRLRIDARKWVLGRMAPKRFSERVELDHKSSDGSMSPKDMTDDQKAAKIAQIYARAAKRKALNEPDDGSDLV